jgi:hypothetical protein
VFVPRLGATPMFLPTLVRMLVPIGMQI